MQIVSGKRRTWIYCFHSDTGNNSIDKNEMKKEKKKKNLNSLCVTQIGTLSDAKHTENMYTLTLENKQTLFKHRLAESGPNIILPCSNDYNFSRRLICGSIHLFYVFVSNTVFLNYRYSLQIFVSILFFVAWFGMRTFHYFTCKARILNWLITSSTSSDVRYSSRTKQTRRQSLHNVFTSSAHTTKAIALRTMGSKHRNERALQFSGLSVSHHTRNTYNSSIICFSLCCVSVK